MIKYDLIVAGAGACGMIAAIQAASQNKKVLLIEKLSYVGAKLKATGGGRCNLSNTLSNEEFMASFGRDGRFMTKALEEFDHKELMKFFHSIGVDTHIPDGFRIFPVTHNSSTILNALQKRLEELDVDIIFNTVVKQLVTQNDKVKEIKTDSNIYKTDNIIIATGGMGYSHLGSEGEGYDLAKELGIKVTDIYPAMLPLKVKETWVANCKADTIAKANIKIDIKKHSKLKQTGDLIFTSHGIRGPVILDFAREITPLLEKYGEVPILINMTKGLNSDQIHNHLKSILSSNKYTTLEEQIGTLIPNSVALEICKMCDANPEVSYNKLEGAKKERLLTLLANTPLTVTGSEGFKKAMITRGGINLKEINPNTMESKKIKGLYFCGEVVNLDGPCGGYNLQWAFASGYLAGALR
ncbi:MAG: NAD(P)/FAD-dependent oxidoreductase [Campylobacterota bacterium]|nr:NAD(P)/FAD-dependent oxidoreductase [Campylobacterota bacterium]